MSDREKLIELLEKGYSFSEEECNKYIGECVSKCCPYYDKSHLCGYIAIAEYMLSNGVTVQRWIPVSERLPDKNSEYLVFLNCVKSTTMLNFALDFIEHDEYGLLTEKKKICFYYCDDDWELIEVPEVTHWMPIQEPQKGAQE